MRPRTPLTRSNPASVRSSMTQNPLRSYRRRAGLLVVVVSDIVRAPVERAIRSASSSRAPPIPWPRRSAATWTSAIWKASAGGRMWTRARVRSRFRNAKMPGPNVRSTPQASLGVIESPASAPDWSIPTMRPSPTATVVRCRAASPVMLERVTRRNLAARSRLPPAMPSCSSLGSEPKTSASARTSAFAAARKVSSMCDPLWRALCRANGRLTLPAGTYHTHSSPVTVRSMRPASHRSER